MNDARFDTLSKELSASHTRRSVLGRLLAGAGLAAGALTFSRLHTTATTVRPACARLHQDCTSLTCCPSLVCEDGTCCTPLEGSCVTNTDCCGDLTCQADLPTDPHRRFGRHCKATV